MNFLRVKIAFFGNQIGLILAHTFFNAMPFKIQDSMITFLMMSFVALFPFFSLS